MKDFLKGIDSIARIHFTVNKWLAAVGGACILVMCFYTTGDVIGRYTLNSPLPAAFEITLILLIFITFWGITYVQARGGHMRLEFLWLKFGRRGRLVLDILSVLIGLFVFAIITWQGWIYAVDAWVTKDSSMGFYTVSTFPARLGLAIGSTSLLIQYVIDLIRYAGQLSIKSEVSEK